MNKVNYEYKSCFGFSPINLFFALVLVFMSYLCADY